MATNGNIAKRIEEIRAWSAKHSDWSDEELLTHVTDLAINAEKDSDKITASKLLLNARGIAQPAEKRRDTPPTIQAIKQTLNIIASPEQAERIVARLEGKTTDD